MLQRDPRYQNIRNEVLPMSESLCGALMRLVPYWTGNILPRLDEGKTVLIVSHANLLRALMFLLENLDAVATENLHVPTAVPLVYRMDTKINIISKITLV